MATMVQGAAANAALLAGIERMTRLLRPTLGRCRARSPSRHLRAHSRRRTSHAAADAYGVSARERVTWSLLIPASMFDGAEVNAIAAAPDGSLLVATDGVVLAGAGNRVFQPNGSEIPIPDAAMTALAAGSGTAYVGTTTGVWISRDGGA